VLQIGELLESIAISVINCVCGVELCGSDWRATGVYCNQRNKLCVRSGAVWFRLESYWSLLQLA
jgi:hypothetical protein